MRPPCVRCERANKYCAEGVKKFSCVKGGGGDNNMRWVEKKRVFAWRGKCTDKSRGLLRSFDRDSNASHVVASRTASIPAYVQSKEDRGSISGLRRRSKKLLKAREAKLFFPFSKSLSNQKVKGGRGKEGKSKVPSVLLTKRKRRVHPTAQKHYFEKTQREH